MSKLMYMMFQFSGVFGGLSFLAALLLKLGGHDYDQLFFYFGLIFWFVIALPLWIISKRLEQKRIAKIIKSHNGNQGIELKQKGKTTASMKGLRSKKSGLSWGGGNIKGANASRGSKRIFMGK